MPNDLDELLKLDNQLCFPLYAASKEIIRRYKPLLDKLDITYTQYLVLLVLWEKDGVLVKELGERLYLDSGTLTPLLVKLEQKKYIIRKKGKDDGRELYIFLTELGKDMKKEAHQVPQSIGGCVKLEANEARTLYTLLYKILRGFNDGQTKEDNTH